MTTIQIHEITQANWRTALKLKVHPEQQHFVADCTPIAAILLAKAYIRPGNLHWIPYAIYADEMMIGLIELAYQAQSSEYWLYHFFIDHDYQGQGYAKPALTAFLNYLHDHFPDCQRVRLTVHPDNTVAQALYDTLGFVPTGEEQYGELVYSLPMSVV